MPCLCPLDAWPAPPGATDRRPVFSAMRSYAGAKAFSIPCGQCVGCRLDKRQSWATRMMHEASLWDANSFVTWTIAPEHMPADQSLDVRTVQLAFKRLRKAAGSFRHATSGEYGEQFHRPHYHSAIFGEDFRRDRYPWKRSEGGILYRSPTAEKAWGLGHVYIAELTRESAGYVAGYIRKKLNGDRLETALQREGINPETGELRQWSVKRPFFITSRKPGIGAGWYERWASDCFPSDFLMVEGRRVAVPRYYLDKLAEGARAQIVAARRARAEVHRDNNTDRRLLVRHEVSELRAKRLLRALDMES